MNKSVVQGMAAAVGTIVTYAFGGWSALLAILLSFVAVDYITGVIAAAVEGKLASWVGTRGIAKKVMIFVLVAMGHLVDQAIGIDANLVRDAVIFFYLANELLSIVENTGRIGLPVPEVLQKAVAVLKSKSDVEVGE